MSITIAARIAKDIGSKLASQATASNRIWCTKYFKDVIPFRGVKTPGIRAVVKEVLEELDASSSPPDVPTKKQVSQILFKSEYAEDKSAATFVLQHVDVAEFGKEDLLWMAKLFDDGFIFDWGTTDGLCGRVLESLAMHNVEYARVITGWRHAENRWRSRASCVAFCSRSTVQKVCQIDETMWEELMEVCRVCVSHPERFSQTGVGWLARQMSVYKRQPIVDFLKNHTRDLSDEALRSATEKMDKSVTKSLLAAKRAGTGVENSGASTAEPSKKGKKKERSGSASGGVEEETAQGGTSSKPEEVEPGAGPKAPRKSSRTQTSKKDDVVPVLRGRGKRAVETSAPESAPAAASKRRK